MSYQTIDAGATERFFTVIAKASGNPIIAGTVNYFLKAKSGADVGKWWRNSDQTWQVAETANAMAHEADGHWEIDLASSPFVDGLRYLEYVKESGDLHVPDSRHLIGAGLSTGNGPRTITVTITDGTNPLENATVQFSEGSTVRYGLTDVNGERAFGLNDATWSYAISKDGYTSEVGTHVVNASQTPLSIVLTATAPPVSDVGLVTGAYRVYTDAGLPQAGVTIHCKLLNVKAVADGAIGDIADRVSVSDVNGWAYFTNLFVGGLYAIGRAASDPQNVQVPSGATSPHLMGSVLGSD